MTYIQRLQQCLAERRASLREQYLRAISAVRDFNPFRAFSMLLSFIVLMSIVHHLNPAKGPMVLWFATKVTIAFWLGYWGDRVLFWYSRPHALEGIARGAAEKRRATIIFACLVVAAFIQ